jgi:imidazolonepropionase-like amidohydrolase
MLMLRRLLCVLVALSALPLLAQDSPQNWAVPSTVLRQPPAPHPIHNEVLIKNGTVLTITHGRIEHGNIYIKDGKIVAIGADVTAPATATVIDATNKFVMPGIVDSHSHMALGGDTDRDDVNEATSPVTPQVRMVDAFHYVDKALYHALAGGVTTALLLHGSANMIGGQDVVIKLKYGLGRDDMIFPNAPISIKMASGENPERVYGSRNQMPSTRMGNFAVLRQALLDGQQYAKDWDDYNAKVKAGDKDAKPPKRDLKLEALADIVQNKFLVQIHCYRADEFLTEMAIAHEFGYRIRAFHHALEVYKVADEVAANGVAMATWGDWWGYKHEAYDATPWDAVISMRKGVRVAIKSDSDDLTRRLNQEAAKTMRYGGATEDEALRMITINPAWIVGVDDRVGSLEPGKDADIVIWNVDPLSTYALAEKVLIDGDVFFDRSLPGYGMPQYKEGQ